ncbi:restriction endonuclease [Streptomyces sp. BI20]|uniref:restriction endonuclease n=1 Tax=Streptomyces sp. BI20 TaxID=3403460 RepID=UPI003C789D70
MGQVYRYRKAVTEGPEPAEIDGLPNYLWVTESHEHTRALLESGINAVGRRTAAGEGPRPVILLRSSPAKAGTSQTPWHDTFDLEHGHVRYYGDHKATSKEEIGQTRGNAAMLAALARHRGLTPEDRAGAEPLLLFRGVSRNGKPKGFVEFCGLGVIERAERIVQWSEDKALPFVNYVYDIALLDLSAEGDAVDWDWILARRRALADPSISNSVFDQPAVPASWRKWVEQGHTSLPRTRRRVARARVRSLRAQRTAEDDPMAIDLRTVYEMFHDRKHDFEHVASAVAARVLGGATGGGYREGWVTRRSGDGGADFVGRVDLGKGIAGTSLVVLGQAKCVKPTQAVSAEQIARVVARLQRGWIGAFVTTGVFSEAAQLEMVEDRYPIALIGGLDLIRELRAMARDDHGGDVRACVEHLITRADVPVVWRRPEEILLD